MLSSPDGFRYSAAAVLTLCFALQAHADPVQEVASLKLYPQTAGWQLISKTPALTPSRLAAVREQLKQVYMAAYGKQEPLESEDCSFIDRALNEEKKAFHSLDVDGDGIADVVYTGSAQCREGDLTLLWRGTRTGFALNKDAAMPVLALRLAPDGIGLSAVSAGCCGDPVSEYTLGNWLNPRQQDTIRLSENTVLPDKLLPQARAFKSRAALKLRSAPVQADRYDHDMSEVMAHAVFGNIQRSYLPGASGNVLAVRKDARGRSWYFVVISRDSDSLLREAPYGVDAGWTSDMDTTH